MPKTKCYQDWVKENYSELNKELFDFGLIVWDYIVNNMPDSPTDSQEQRPEKGKLERTVDNKAPDDDEDITNT